MQFYVCVGNIRKKTGQMLFMNVVIVKNFILEINFKNKSKVSNGLYAQKHIFVGS